MGKEYLLYEKDAQKRIAWITFNKPEKQNMLTIDEYAMIPPLLREIERDDDVKVLIFKGAGECFGSGADVMELGPGTVGFTRDPTAPRPTVRKRLLGERDMGYDTVSRYGGLAPTLHFGKPCIAQVHGYCYGGHFQIATGCDIIICSEEALFVHPAFRYIMEAWPMSVWLDFMGPHRIAEMVFTGRPFTAQEMEKCGFVNKVVPRDKLEEEVNEIASVITLQPLDVLATAKHYLQTLMALRNNVEGTNLVGCFAHLLSTYMRLEPGDFSVLKEVTRKGPSGMIDERERRYPPKYRMSYKGRAAKE